MRLNTNKAKAGFAKKIGGSLILGCLLFFIFSGCQATDESTVGAKDSAYLAQETEILPEVIPTEILPADEAGQSASNNPQKREDRLQIKSFAEEGYALYFKKKPLLLKGVIYNPTPIGEGYDYDLFSDENKPWLIDGQLMKEMGINCLRIYSTGKDLEKVKEFIRDMYEKFGIYTIIGDWLGLWDYPRANYADDDFKAKTKQRVLKIVEALKDEEGLLFWILGNENNYTFSGKIGFWTSPEIEAIEDPYQRQIKRAKIYYAFVGELVRMIKEIDEKHLVALGNGEASYLEYAASECNNVDLLAIIVYRGKRFGNLFNNIRNSFDKPILLSEFGCDSYDAYKEQESQDKQNEFLLSQWEDLYNNTAFSGLKSANVIGGCLFEWSDEWWKHNEGYVADWNVHNTEAGWSEGAYFFDIRAKNNLNMNEEWFGLVSLNEEIQDGINKRIPKKAYYSLGDYFSQLKLFLPE